MAKHPLHGKAVPGHPGLQYWGPNAYIRARIVVPADARQRVGKVELVQGLGTQCVSEAVRRSRIPLADFERQIAEARAANGKANPRTVLYLPKVNDQAELDRVFKAACLIAANPDRGVNLRLGDPADFADDDLPLAGFTYEAGIEEWIKSKGNEPPAAETIGVYRGHLRRFFDHLGHDDMGKVTEDDIADYPNVLVAGSDGKQAVANKSVNNHMASIRAVFRVAKAKRKITTDPTAGNVHKLKVRKSAVRDRKGFDRDQHAKIIAEALTLPHTDPRRWLWLLGAIYGGRIGEFADASVSAVRTVHGRLCFEIGEEYRNRWNGAPLRLKTDGSPRILPLHSALVQFGFLDYVEPIRARGDTAPLFPMIPVNQYGKRSQDASRQCMAWLRDRLGIEDHRLVFHSTRHTVKTFLRGRVPDQVMDAITGHDDGSVSYHYGETELQVIADAIEKHIPVSAVALPPP